MKITIEPTGDDEDQNDFYHTVTVERPGNDYSLKDVLELVESALKAWGFSGKSVDEYVGGEK